MKRITHGDEYIELTDALCAKLSQAHIINPCESDEPCHDYHPAFGPRWWN